MTAGASWGDTKAETDLPKATPVSVTTLELERAFSQMMPTVSCKMFLFAKDMPTAHSSLYLSRAETPKGRNGRP